jgi:hypothetical protein
MTWPYWSKYSISGKEAQDEAERDRRDFDTDDLDREAEDDRIRRSQEGPPDDG